MKLFQFIAFVSVFWSCTPPPEQSFLNEEQESIDLFVSEIITISHIETLKWEKYYIPVFTTKFKLINNSDSNIFLLGEDKYKHLPVFLSSYYIELFGRDSNFFFTYDLDFAVKQDSGWTPNLGRAIRDDRKACLFIPAKDSVELWYCNVYEASRNREFVDYSQNFDSIGFTLLFTTTTSDFLSFSLEESEEDPIFDFISGAIGRDNSSAIEHRVHFPVTKIDTTYDLIKFWDKVRDDHTQYYYSNPEYRGFIQKAAW